MASAGSLPASHRLRDLARASQRTPGSSNAVHPAGTFAGRA